MDKIGAINLHIYNTHTVLSLAVHEIGTISIGERNTEFRPVDWHLAGTADLWTVQALAP